VKHPERPVSPTWTVLSISAVPGGASDPFCLSARERENMLEEHCVKRYSLKGLVHCDTEISLSRMCDSDWPSRTRTK
jgi:hypothetical protein